MKSTHPLQLLRSFLAAHEQTAEYSTQKGFGEMVGRSDVTIRHIEKGSVAMSPKLAGIISARVGVDPKWLLQGKPTTKIPSAFGGELTNEIVLARIREHRQSQVTREATVDAESLVERFIELTRTALLKGLGRRDTKFMVALSQALMEEGMFDVPDPDDLTVRFPNKSGPHLEINSIQSDAGKRRPSKSLKTESD